MKLETDAYERSDWARHDKDQPNDYHRRVHRDVHELLMLVANLASYAKHDMTCMAGTLNPATGQCNMPCKCGRDILLDQVSEIGIQVDDFNRIRRDRTGEA